MKYVIYYISVALLLSSCTTSIRLTSIETLEPALVTFPPEVTRVVIVNNSPTPQDEEDANHQKNDSPQILSLDSVRTIMLNSLNQFMNEEAYFTQVALYPYKTNNSPILKDVTPLSRRKVQSICSETKADALISLDMFAVTAQIESENTAYFTNYSILKANLGSIIRVFSKDGDQYISKMTYVDSLFSEGPAFWDVKRNYIAEVNTLITDLAIVGADKLTGKFIPSWKKRNRWYYLDGSSEMKQAAGYAEQGNWQQASDIWENLYAKETKPKKKAKLASNIALAKECLDEIDEAYQWIETSFEQLPEEKSKSDLVTQIAIYKHDLYLRKVNKEKLKDQLGIIEDDEYIEE